MREWWVESPDLDKVADAPLISDIEMLSNMLAEVVKRENPAVYDLYTRFRKHGMDRASLSSTDEDDVAGSVASFEAMKTLARDISPRDARGVMKTFGIALNLVNAAEVHHRMRLVRNMNSDGGGRGGGGGEAGVVGPLPMVEDSMCGTMEILLNGNGSPPVDPEKIFDKLMTQKCEIVLTAHPTEVNRKTLIRKCEFFPIRFVALRFDLICFVLFCSFRRVDFCRSTMFVVSTQLIRSFVSIVIHRTAHR
jgi:phosphoenolpyruvate carboxylase